MARTNVYNSASSQFFICHKTSGCEHLDGQYAGFGYVIYGMDVVDAIAKVSTDAYDQPTTDVIISSIRFVTVPEQTEQPEQTEDTSNETNA
jgi:peptidyl-prolyl cis-trans isomerase B (cyclophilin B)